MNRSLYFIALLIVIFTACQQKGNVKTSVLEDKNHSSADTISGIYKTVADSNLNELCEMSVEITKRKDGYFYRLKTNVRDVSGKVRLIAEEKEHVLVLEGIRWDDYEGDISSDLDEEKSNDAVKEAAEIPIGIGAVVGKDTLQIQNYGNAMNYYTKIGECGRKFIVLVKQ